MYNFAYSNGKLPPTFTTCRHVRQDAVTKVQELNEMNTICEGGQAFASWASVAKLLMTIETHRCRPAAGRLRLTKQQIFDLIPHSARQRASDAQYHDPKPNLSLRARCLPSSGEPKTC